MQRGNERIEISRFVIYRRERKRERKKMIKNGARNKGERKEGR